VSSAPHHHPTDDPVPADPPLPGHRLADDPASTAAETVVEVGRIRLLAVSDGFLVMSRDMLGTPEARTAAHDALSVTYGDEVRLPLGCFVLLGGDQVILVDTGFGPVDFAGKGTMVGGNLLPQLARHGIRPEDVDVVAVSHLHADHSGTLGDVRTGRPVFPNARTVLGAGDWEHFITGHVDEVAEHTAAALAELDRRGQLELVDGEVDVAAGLRRLPAPGHTPGHSIFAVHDRGERVLLFGDAMYCPQQLSQLDWTITFDVDPALARRTRERYQRDLEAHGGGALGCHFPELKLARLLTG
jgi:glyoxylase-like metal-dependent hydrolase (beta-lactamase superfamily II)